MNTVVLDNRETSSVPMGPRQLFVDAWFLWLGAAALAIPTFLGLARDYWSDEQGGHGPIVLATGIWLLVRARHRIAAVVQPGLRSLTVLGLAACLPVYVFARMTGMLGIECLAFYGAFITIYYYHAGLRAVWLLWFPLIYFLFMFPLPETLILPLSHALKLGLSNAAVAVFDFFGYQVGQSGVVIYVDQYELLVATACSGMNSLIGLAVISVFYAYVRHDGNWRASLPLLLVIAPIALFSNFIRVLVLIFVTHHFGDRVAQVYVHGPAGVMVFAIAVSALLAVDKLVSWIGDRRRVRR